MFLTLKTSFFNIKTTHCTVRCPSVSLLSSLQPLSLLVFCFAQHMNKIWQLFFVLWTTFCESVNFFCKLWALYEYTTDCWAMTITCRKNSVYLFSRAVRLAQQYCQLHRDCYRKKRKLITTFLPASNLLFSFVLNQTIHQSTKLV